VINVYSSILECRLALFKLAFTFKGIYAKLHLIIGQFIQEKELKDYLAYY
jgi:hypothetical protein